MKDLLLLHKNNDFFSTRTKTLKEWSVEEQEELAALKDAYHEEDKSVKAYGEIFWTEL